MITKVLLALLLIFFILLRLFPIWGNNFPYGYDNAKDSLVLMEMWQYKKPALLGSVTSLEGLYQGPFWYYVLFPLNIILGFHPFASVLTVIILGVFTTYIFWKYLGKLTAFLYTVSAAVIPTHQTAWSPYLTMFSTAWVLVILSMLKQKVSTLHLILLSFCVSILFHAEIAFGVVFTILLIVIFILKKIHLSLKQIFLMIFIFLIPFIPQILFEMRHEFLQTHSVIRFFTNYQNEAGRIQGNQKGFLRIAEVATYIANSGLESILPYHLQTFPVTLVILMCTFLLVLVKVTNDQLKKQIRTIILPMILGSFLLYLVLPIKSYYLIGLTPFWIFGFSKLIELEFKFLYKPVVIIFLIVATISMIISRDQYRILAYKSRILFEPKRQAVEAVYEFAKGRSFTSYQYVPEVYDYTYQHIFQYTSLAKKRELPQEYSYAPHESAYMSTKKMQGSHNQPVYTMLIVEADERPQFFPLWWDKITARKKILKMQKINEAITIYQLISEEKSE